MRGRISKKNSPSMMTVGSTTSKNVPIQLPRSGSDLTSTFFSWSLAVSSLSSTGSKLTVNSGRRSLSSLSDSSLGSLTSPVSFSLPKKVTLLTLPASRVGAIPEVRANLLKFQKEFSSNRLGAVLDGRDIGTVICPDAPVKLFVTASTEVRADRRYRELRAQGVDTIKPRVLAEMAERDRRDSERAAAPLRAAPDAWLLDTSDMDADAAVAAALAFIERKGFRAAGP